MKIYFCKKKKKDWYGRQKKKKKGAAHLYIPQWVFMDGMWIIMGGLIGRWLGEKSQNQN